MVLVAIIAILLAAAAGLVLTIQLESVPLSPLEQVIVNLLDNAIKYTPDKGAIQLRVFAANGHAVLEVEDHGMGIPAEALPHIFDRFYRVDPARSADSESAGLGLAIVKSICAAHGAEVEAQSVFGRGSCFRVRLPLLKN